MSMQIKVDFTSDFRWNYSPGQLAMRKGFVKELYKYYADRVAFYSRDYVPFDTGFLATNVQTYGASDHGTITYKASYAEAQYYGENGSGVEEKDWKRKKSPNPLATSFWDKAAWSAYGDRIVKEVDRKRKQLAKKS